MASAALGRFLDLFAQPGRLRLDILAAYEDAFRGDVPAVVRVVRLAVGLHYRALDRQPGEQALRPREGHERRRRVRRVAGSARTYRPDSHREVAAEFELRREHRLDRVIRHRQDNVICACSIRTCWSVGSAAKPRPVNMVLQKARPDNTANANFLIFTSNRGDLKQELFSIN